MNKKRNAELRLMERNIEQSKYSRTFIEPSINSTRISMKIKQMDEIDVLLTKLFTNFLMRRAENFIILRRKPIKDMDISFLITNQHLDELYREKLVEFILMFVAEVDKEIAEMKLQVNTKARIAATHFVTGLAED